MPFEASDRREAEIPTHPDLAGKGAVVTGDSGGITLHVAGGRTMH